MARSKASRSVFVEPGVLEADPVIEESATQDLESEDETEVDASGSKAMTKARAARIAIGRGIESLQQAVSFILREYGIDMAPQHFSAVKSQFRKKERDSEDADPATPAPRRGRPPALSSLYAQPARRVATDEEMGLLDAIEAIKPLVESLGADRVKRIVDLLG